MNSRDIRIVYRNIEVYIDRQLYPQRQSDTCHRCDRTDYETDTRSPSVRMTSDRNLYDRVGEVKGHEQSVTHHTSIDLYTRLHV